MPHNLIHEPHTNKKILSNTYKIIFFILVIALITVIFTSIRTDIVTNSVLKKENLLFLLIISDDNGPIVTEGVLFNAKTKRLALVDVPYQAGDLLPQIKRSDRYSVFYQRGDIGAYQRSIEKLLNVEFLFTLDLHTDQLIKLVDLLEGIQLYFFAPIDRIDPLTQKRYIYPAGEQSLDGDQSCDFLYAGRNTLDYSEYLELEDNKHTPVASVKGKSSKELPKTRNASPRDAETSEDPTNGNNFQKNNVLRQKNLRYVRELILGIVSTLQEHNLEREEYIRLIYSYFQTSLSKRSFRKLLLYLNEIDTKSAEVIFQDYLGEERMVNERKINFPIYNGQVIRSQVVRILTQLRSQDTIITAGYPVRVEVLNGTNILGLASRTGELYTREGFDVINIGNADRSDYEKTVVINLHSNSLDDVRRVAALIDAQNMVLQPLPGGEHDEAEVRVVLGKDFDGSQVAK